MLVVDQKDDKEKGFNNDNLKTKEEHLRVPKINACDLKVQSNPVTELNENF